MTTETLDKLYLEWSQFTKAKTARELQLERLIEHCWIYSGYENCGYRKMTTEQKSIFDKICNADND